MLQVLDDTVTGVGKPLKVLIAGAGLAGLATAIALRRQGHDVEVSLLKRMVDEVSGLICST